MINFDDLKDVSDEELLNQYDIVKQEMEYQDSLSAALKTFLNSLYGATALKSNVFSNGKLTAASIATSGRFANKFVGYNLSVLVDKLRGITNDCVNSLELKYIVQADTDSVYIALGDYTEEIIPNATIEEKLDKIQEVTKKYIQPKINETIEHIHTRLNTYNKDVLEMDQEIIADTFASIASKMYFCNILMSDGNKLAKPKLKATGISLISKSTPDEIKKLLKPITSIVLEDNNKKLLEYIKDTKSNFLCIPPENISKALSVSSLNYKWKNKNGEDTENWKMAEKANVWKEIDKKFLTTPINSKASLVHNELIKEHNLESKHDYILPNDKIKIIYIKTPNPITGRQNIVAFKNDDLLYDVPGLINYLDLELQWEKEFINKIKAITDTLKYSLDFNNTEIDEDEW